MPLALALMAASALAFPLAARRRISSSSGSSREAAASILARRGCLLPHHLNAV